MPLAVNKHEGEDEKEADERCLLCDLLLRFAEVQEASHVSQEHMVKALTSVCKTVPHDWEARCHLYVKGEGEEMIRQLTALRKTGVVAPRSDTICNAAHECVF